MSDLDDRFYRIIELLKANDTSMAYEQSSALVDSNPTVLNAWLVHSQVQQRRNDFHGMLHSTRTALDIEPKNPDVVMRHCLALMLTGGYSEAIKYIDKIASSSSKHHDRVSQIGELYTQAKKFVQAHRCYQQAVKLQPENSKMLYNLASSHIAMGNFAQAGTLFNQVIAIDPSDFDAYQNRSTLRTQTQKDNHTEELESVLEQFPHGEIALCHALAKEYEDLKDYRKSFAYLKRGANARKKRLTYSVKTDLDTFALIKKTFNSSLVSDLRKIQPNTSSTSSHQKPLPIFVLGLPRSGTTLVERILSSHADIMSLGEINDFALSLINSIGGGYSKKQLIQQSAKMNLIMLAQRYRSALTSYGQNTIFTIDKTPLNFLYLGLIRLALPEAKIIHVRRDAMDSCFAMYKTLFRMAYPFSYDLTELAEYYLAYNDLMSHWQAVFPGEFLDVDYENLVNNPEPVSRDMIEFCDLPWQAQCLQHHLNPSPSATASAAQVRVPIYTSSVERWKCYKQELGALRTILESGGIQIA